MENAMTPSSALLVRFRVPDRGPCVGVLSEGLVHDVTPVFGTLTGWLEKSIGNVDQAIAALLRAATASPYKYPVEDLNYPPGENQAHWLPPIDDQDVWAAGVTYERSREARQEEAVDGGTVYDRVYRADRPELFFKARGSRVVGHYAGIGVRGDATLSVPEPELTLVMNSAGDIVGFTIGNDMSSRDIEGANPLYLPQAKMYTASCALGPGIWLTPQTQWPSARISIAIQRGLLTVFSGETHTGQIRRTLVELWHYLWRSNRFPGGVYLLTGTGVVPPIEFTVAPGDEIRISIEGIGTLTNTVKLV
jgi:2-dehydro-3-deoxy-D-arabinonate dehydratase